MIVLQAVHGASGLIRNEGFECLNKRSSAIQLSHTIATPQPLPAKMNLQDSISITAKELRFFMRRIKKAISDLNNEPASSVDGNSTIVALDSSNREVDSSNREVDEVFSSLMKE
jgi:hypothetical protein